QACNSAGICIDLFLRGFQDPLQHGMVVAVDGAVLERQIKHPLESVLRQLWWRRRGDVRWARVVVVALLTFGRLNPNPFSRMFGYDVGVAFGVGFLSSTWHLNVDSPEARVAFAS